MKTIITTLAIVALTLGSCQKKEEQNNPEVESNLAFGGSITKNGHVYINGVEKQLNIIYKVKTGDVAKFVDLGEDNYVAAVHLHAIGGNGLCTSNCTQAYTVQGNTYGTIIIDNGVSVATYNGKGDCNLSYTVK